jgi:hypothetical protein
MSMPSPATPPTSAIVAVQSAWWSKINWTAVVGVVAAVFGIFNIDFSEETQRLMVQLLTSLLGVVVPSAIILMRTKYTTTVTPGSVASTPVVVNQKVSVEAVTPPGPVAITVSPH